MMKHRMTMRRMRVAAAFRKLSGGILLLLLTVCMGVAAQAADFPDAEAAVPLLYVGEDEDDGYRYAQGGTGIGFSSVFREDSSEAELCALFEIDDGVYYELWRNGEQIPYESGELIIEEGDFQLLIAPSEGQRETCYSVFRFHLNEPEINIFDNVVTVSYVRAYEMFGFSGNGEPLFMLSVPNGGISRETVYYAPVSGNVSIDAVYFNAKKQRGTAPQEFSEPGNYLIKLSIGIISEYWVAFHILSSSDCTMTFLPFSEEICCLSQSGAQLAGTTLYLQKDGAYQFRFSCPASGSDMTWDESLSRDTVLPGICFSEHVGSGRVHRETHVTALSPDASMAVYWDELPQSSFDGSFTRDGRYRVIVSDRAGNTQDISFSLYQFKQLLLMGGSAVGILVIMLFLSKRKLTDVVG